MRENLQLAASAGEMKKRIKLGVIADEFFEPAMGRMGGFGWAARQVSRIFNDDPSQGVDVVFLSGELRSSATLKETRVARHARDSAAAGTHSQTGSRPGANGSICC